MSEETVVWVAERLGCPVEELQESRGAHGSLFGRRSPVSFGGLRLYVGDDGTVYSVPSAYPGVRRVEASLTGGSDFARTHRVGEVGVQNGTNDPD